MAGHSKWANIKRQKAVVDQKRGKEFTKLIREITVSAKQNPDKSQNPRLRLAIEKALSQNMGKQTIERAINKASGQLTDDQVEEIIYEGYGPGGCAIIVECLSDNRNRTVSEGRHAFNKHGGNLGTDGSVLFMFDHKGLIVVSSSIDEQTLFDIALDSGAEDITQDEDSWCIITTKDMLYQVSQQLSHNNLSIESAQLQWLAKNKTDVNPKDKESIEKLLDRLDDLDDVQAIFTNANL